MSYLTAAHARLLHALVAPPAEINLHQPTAQDFIERGQYVQNVLREFGEYFHALARDTASNTSLPIDVRECVSVLQEAGMETDFVCSLTDCAERVVEDAMEPA